MIEKELLEEIIGDLHFDGKYCKFYEMLQEELDKHSDRHLENMRGTLKFVYPGLVSEIDGYDKMRVLYEYSLLP